MHALGRAISVFGVAIAVLASLANLVVALIALFHLFGNLALIGILLFPVAMGAYPFIVWIVNGSAIYFAVWGGLWGAFILGGIIASIGSRVAGEEG